VSVETPESSRLPHLPRVQALRGIAALAVVLSHLYVIEGKSSPDQILGAWARFGMAGVDLFFVISGFIMVYVSWQTPRGVSAPLPFLWRRVSRIYPLYWIVSGVLLAVWLLRPEMVFASNPDPDILRSFLLLPQTGEPLLAVGWTLIHEMYFYLVFAGILVLPRRFMGIALAVWCVSVATVASVFETPASPTLALIFNPLLFEFVAGAGLAWMYVRRGTVNLLPIFAGLIAFAIGNWFFMDPMAGDVLSDHMLRATTVGPIAIAVFAIFGIKSKLIETPILVWLGDISYALYLTHVLTLSLVGRIMEPMMGDGWFDNVGLIALMLMASLIVAHLTYIWIERPLIRFFRRRRQGGSSRASVSD
jgi:peptidoglycan/LPS O-acetylase OafA/YrhL